MHIQKNSEEESHKQSPTTNYRNTRYDMIMINYVWIPLNVNIKGERETSYRSDLAINHNLDSMACGASGNEILNDFVW